VPDPARLDVVTNVSVTSGTSGGHAARKSGRDAASVVATAWFSEPGWGD